MAEGAFWFIWSRLFPVWRDSLQWRHNDHDGVSNHQPHGCLLNRLFRRRSKKKSKLPVTGLCVGNSPGPVNSPHQRASYAENVSIRWRHHVFHTHQIRGGVGLRLSDCFLCYCVGLDDIFQKNIGRHAAHNIVWWPNHKHWLIIYTSDLMMIR